jgi:DNA-binding NtrC family response regulator
MAWSDEMQPILRILLADPDAATLATLEEFLYREGYATITAQTARGAYQLIETEHPSLLLVSIDLDWYEAGLDLVALIRREAATSALPVILCTGDLLGLHMHQSELAAWNCHILETPFTEEALVTTLQAALESRLQSHAIGG